MQDIGLEQSPPIRFVYEAMCWSTYAFTWAQGWEIVQKVNRPNFGICLDSFHIAGWEYADPALRGGVRPGGPERLRNSIAELSRTVTSDRIYYIQLEDAERLDTPLVEGSPYYDKEQLPRMSWSRNCRLFPYEIDEGGYMPIEDVAKAILATNFQGFIR